MYDTILFDLDGTLSDTFEGITNSVAHALKKFNIDVADKRVLIPFIGPPLYESCMVYYGFSKADALKAVEYYREYYADKGIFECFLYDGVAETLRTLYTCGKRLVLATSKPEIFAERILQKFDLAQFFCFVAGATLDSARVAKVDVIKYALESCGAENLKRCLMVGDRKHDIAGAKANGLSSAGVLYGYGGEDELRQAGADYILHNFSQLLEIKA